MSMVPASEKYNFGRAGAGNLFIANRIGEANEHFQFTKGDLLLVMWTSMTREDRFLEGEWQSHGNVFNQSYYDANFVKNYVDPVGCAVRDLGLMSVSMQLARALACDTLALQAMPFFDAPPTDVNPNLEYKLAKYDALLTSFPPNLVETEFPNGMELVPNLREEDGRIRQDMHPTPERHLSYLKSIGVPITSVAESYVAEAMVNMQQCRVFPKDFKEAFIEEGDRRALAFRLLT